MCAQKLTQASLICRTGPTTKKWKKENVKSKKNPDMLRSIGKQSGDSVQSVLKGRIVHAKSVKVKNRDIRLGVR